MRAQKGLSQTLLLELSPANRKEVKPMGEEEKDVCPECGQEPCVCEEEEEEE